MMENVQIVGDRVVFGMQVPIQSQSRLFVSDWELTATVADLAAIATAADRNRTCTRTNSRACSRTISCSCSCS